MVSSQQGTATDQRILRQRDWTEQELRAAGFRYYLPVKRLTMARLNGEAKTITTRLETLLASAGDVICYSPGDTRRQSLDEYEHWPVRRDLFMQNYRPWDETDWKPTAAQQDLLDRGCRPFYRAAGIWAKRLRRPLHVQSLESPEPTLIPPGRWLCIGAHGEPYNMDDANFRSRYLVPPDSLRDRLFWAAIGLAYPSQSAP
jgi:hypothetical protein